MREMCETDTSAMDVLADWMQEAAMYEFTRYYSYIVLRTPMGFVACYADNPKNYWNI